MKFIVLRTCSVKFQNYDILLSIVTILEGAEVRIGFYGRGGRILRGDTPEGAEGPEGWPRG